MPKPSDASMLHQNEATKPATVAVPSKGAVFLGSFAPTQRDETLDKGLHVDHGKLTSPHLLGLFTSGWTDSAIWMSAFVELVGTMSLCYLSALIDVTIGNLNTVFIPAWAGITNVFLLSLHIISLAPASGGHVNPLITFATATTGLTGVSRAVLYMIGQLAGGALAGGLVRGTFGSDAITKYEGGGCFLDTDTFSIGQAFLIEVVCSFILLFLAFGTALDPRQAQITGPFIGPFLVAFSLGLISLAGAGLAPGYTGAGMNPARCFAFAVGRRNFRDQWIWWVGPFAGSVLHTAMYRAVPPYHEKKVNIPALDHQRVLTD